MKIPIKRPAIASQVVARPTIARPPLVVRPALSTVAKPALKSASAIPESVHMLAIKAEENNRLKNKHNSSYEAQRKQLTAWMKDHKVSTFTAIGMLDDEQKTVIVAMEDTSRSKLDLAKLLEVTGLTLEELYAQGILSATAAAVKEKLGAAFADDATVAGTPNIQATLTAI